MSLFLSCIFFAGTASPSNLSQFFSSSSNGTMAGASMATVCNSTTFNQIRVNNTNHQMEYCSPVSSTWTNVQVNPVPSVQFSIPNIAGVGFGVLVTSATVSTVGSGTGTISISGSGSPQLSVAGGAWTTSATITAGQTLALRMTSSSVNLETRTAAITIGGLTTSWSLTSGVTIILANGYRSYSDGTYANSCNQYLNSSSPFNYSGDTGSGIYRIAVSGVNYDVYCDMTTDGGGWTLVYLNTSGNTSLYSSTGGTGSIACLSSPNSSCSAKIPDTAINTIGGTGSGTAITYRVTNPSQSIKVYFPKACVYAQTSTSPTACMQATTTYSNSPTYTQYTTWGGNGGGLNAWYTSSGYETRAVTNSSYGCGGGNAGIGSGGSGPSNGCTDSVLIWVRN